MSDLEKDPAITQVVTQATPQGPVTVVRDPKWFGRLQSIDFKDHNYLFPRQRSTVSSITSKIWSMPRDIRPGEIPLNQQATPRCVAFSLTHLLLAGPVKNKRSRQHRTPEEMEAFCQSLYHEAQLIDEWPGENYDGTSVRAGLKALQRRGYIPEYRWHFEVDPAVLYLLTLGPLALGIDWTDTMSNPIQFRKDTFITCQDGIIEGGHAILAIGADRRRKCPDGSTGAIRLLNSWGEDWGDQGRVWLSFHDFGILLHANGECGAPTEIYLPDTFN